MKIKLKKTDKRMTGHSQYMYYVDIRASSFSENANLMFYRLRMWCWDTWGASREVDQFDVGLSQPDQDPGDKNPHWGWINDQYRNRLYLAGVDEAALFTLKWS
jgi:hypothetical protein